MNDWNVKKEEIGSFTILIENSKVYQQVGAKRFSPTSFYPQYPDNVFCVTSYLLSQGIMDKTLLVICDEMMANEYGLIYLIHLPVKIKQI